MEQRRLGGFGALTEARSQGRAPREGQLSRCQPSAQLGGVGSGGTAPFLQGPPQRRRPPCWPRGRPGAKRSAEGGAAQSAGAKGREDGWVGRRMRVAREGGRRRMRGAEAAVGGRRRGRVREPGTKWRRGGGRCARRGPASDRATTAPHPPPGGGEAETAPCGRRTDLGTRPPLGVGPARAASFPTPPLPPPPVSPPHPPGPAQRDAAEPSRRAAAAAPRGCEGRERRRRPRGPA